jgi:hypothetical protein
MCHVAPLNFPGRFFVAMVSQFDLTGNYRLSCYPINATCREVQNGYGR